MKLFILILLTAFLFNPCTAQAMNSNHYSSFPSSFQKYSASGGNFDKIVIVLWRKNYTDPVQVKIIPITDEQVQSFLQSIEGSRTTWDINNNIPNSIGTTINGYTTQSRDGFLTSSFNNGVVKIIHNEFESSVLDEITGDSYTQGNIMHASPGNGGGGVLYQTGFTGLQNDMHFADETAQAKIIDENDWSRYRVNVETIIQEIIEAYNADSLSDFYKMNDHLLNGIIYVVGPGNGGGGTYVK